MSDESPLGVIREDVPAPDRRPRRSLLRRVATALAAAVLVASGAVLGGAAAVIALAPAPTAIPTATPAAIATPGSLEAAIAEVLPAVVTVISTNAAGQTISSGTGVVIDRALGYVVTNSHVVEDPRSTRVTGNFAVLLSNGTRLAARIVGNDPNTDVAVLRVDGPLPAEARLAKHEAALGAQVIAIGSPGTSGRASRLLANTVTSGIVSATGRSVARPDLRNVQLEDLIQTDAPINAGMSGGPLVSVATREVIGLNTLVLRGSGEEGLGFAVSAATVAQVSARLIATGQ